LDAFLVGPPPSWQIRVVILFDARNGCGVEFRHSIGGVGSNFFKQIFALNNKQSLFMSLGDLLRIIMESNKVRLKFRASVFWRE